ncbi:GerAB/ArcD/ProY family transporter [Aneurinibacillus uraniidurans]|uniref:GerAB/ArcD/ProY family transporter n=1 Tax=Aneurinibacillus uraniidurans TaxID=2966586 RepID=UPI00234AA8D5|nr:endospore germination permease [Aneurinibacillus sp. B1]WCN39519.1 endospore germination permease [Aneurinibacillus sp. B1]
MNTFKEISFMQYVLAIHGVEVATSILTLPSSLAKIAGTDGWISIVLGWILSIIVGLCVVSFMSKYPGETFQEILIRYTGKILGKAIMIVWIFYAMFSGISILFITLFLLQEWILPHMPRYVIAALFMCSAFPLFRGGVNVLARYAVFVFFFTLFLPALLLIPLKDSQLLYILPILKDGWIPIFYGIKETAVGFLGFEMAVLFYPYLKNKQAAVKGMVIANTLTLIIYLQITLSCFVYFSPDEITQFLWPTLTLVKPIKFPFLERLEIIFLSFYIFLFSAAFISYFFFAIDSLRQLFNKPKWKIPYLILPFIVILSAVFTLSYEELGILKQWWGIADYIVGYTFPVLFFLYVTVYTYWRRGKSREKTS